MKRRLIKIIKLYLLITSIKWFAALCAKMEQVCFMLFNSSSQNTDKRLTICLYLPIEQVDGTRDLTTSFHFSVKNERKLANNQSVSWAETQGGKGGNFSP